MESIEGILLRHSARGMTKLALELPVDFCARAARQVLSWPLGKVALLTGFDVGGAPETDGPTGTYVMAKALMKLGFTPVVVSEAPVCAYFNELHIQTSTVQPDDSDNAMGRLLDSLSPVGIVSLERCGRNLHSRYCNMRGVDISRRTSPTDELVVQAARRNIPTIGVGDGGNEIGMGNVAHAIARKLTLEPCVVTVDNLVGDGVELGRLRHSSRHGQVRPGKAAARVRPDQRFLPIHRRARKRRRHYRAPRGHRGRLLPGDRARRGGSAASSIDAGRVNRGRRRVHVSANAPPSPVHAD